VKYWHIEIFPTLRTHEKWSLFQEKSALPVARPPFFFFHKRSPVNLWDKPNSGLLGMASAANLMSRNVLLFATYTKTAAAAVNKQYHLQSISIWDVNLRHLETCNIFKNYCAVIFSLSYIVQRVNNVLICIIPVFTSLTTKLDRTIPMFASAETGSQLLTATLTLQFSFRVI
jgi:hypothetical protein